MTLTFQVRPEKKAAIAAAVHVDGSARVQSVRRDQNERYYDLIKAFAAKKGGTGGIKHKLQSQRRAYRQFTIRCNQDILHIGT
jgi:carbamoyltransferase-like protein